VRRRPVAFGIDPGATVGMATYVRGRFFAHQLPKDDALSWIQGWLQRQLDNDEHVDGGLEAFVRGSATGHHTSRQDDAEDFNQAFIRMCEAITPDNVWGIETRLQGAGDAKAVMPDSTLKLVGWHRPGSRHANDGARHLGLCLLTRHPDEYARVLAGEFLDMNKVKEG
jgi:hypothetical protein